MDAPDPAGPDRVDLYLRLAGHSRTVFRTCPVYVTANPGGKFGHHRPKLRYHLPLRKEGIEAGSSAPRRPPSQRSGLPFSASAHTAILIWMYAQKFQVEVLIRGERRPCPLEWLDQFSMRNFTNAADFDDTLPVADGQLEASFRLTPERFAEGLAAWLTQRGKGEGQPVQVEVKIL